jgi:hypothetical protein
MEKYIVVRKTYYQLYLVSKDSLMGFCSAVERAGKSAGSGELARMGGLGERMWDKHSQVLPVS